MEYYLLQSGSSGNSCLIITKDSRIIIDVGLTYKVLVNRINELGFSIDDIDAFLITHEHGDHIKSINYIPKSKIYATKETLEFSDFNIINPYFMFNINNTHIVPISISHDINNGVGFVIDDEEERLVYLTDTGMVKNRNIPFMKNADHYVLESNHNEYLLMVSNRPRYLKNRILSNKGHLSNIQCGEVLLKCIGDLTRDITLAHISAECNTEEKALFEVKKVLTDSNINIDNICFKVASRTSITKGGK